MLERLPERVRTPAVARAVTSPSAILLAGAGTSLAILGGLPVVAAAAVGAVAWAARVAFAVPKGPRKDRIDPFTVGEPWRRFVQDAVRAQHRYQRTVGRVRPGPLQERLVGLGDRIEEAVTECWRIARQGHSLEGAFKNLDVRGVKGELAEVEEELAETSDERSRAALERTRAAVEAQLRSAQRIQSVARDAADRLRLLNAQLDEAVARAVELSLHAEDAGQVAPLSSDVDTLVGDLEALRQALEETGGVASSP